MTRAGKSLFVPLAFIAALSGCHAGEPAPATPPVAAVEALPEPVAAAPVRAEAPRLPDLAARCEAVDWNGPRERETICRPDCARSPRS